MYNTKMICTYYYYDAELKKKIPFEFLSSNFDVDVENDEICDLIYQTDYLQIFNLTDFDYTEINTVMKQIYETDGVKSSTKLKECMKKAATVFLSEDPEIGFMALFSYDYLFATHLCICDALESGSIQEKHLNLLAKLVLELE